MGKRGPQPTPTQTLRNRGSRLVKGREGEPPADSTEFTDACPDWLGDRAKETWFDVVPKLKGLGIIGAVDPRIVIDFCHFWGRFVELCIDCPNDIHNQAKASDKAWKAGAKLGLSPADRVGLKTEKPEKKDNQKLKIV